MTQPNSPLHVDQQQEKVSKRADLPPELWLEVFYWACCPLAGFSASYIPFEDNRLRIQDLAANEKQEPRSGLESPLLKGTSSVIAYRAWVRLNLGLVCRQWYTLSVQPLLTEISLRRGIPALERQLLRSVSDGPEHSAEARREGDSSGDFASLVRLIVLPYSTTQTPTSAHDLLKASLRIIQQCPNIEVLIRPPLTSFLEHVKFQFSIDDMPVLHSLKRLEWAHHTDAPRTGGINAIQDVLSCSPNLRFLTIGGDIRIQHIRSKVITMPLLSTIRLRRISILGVRLICDWDLPMLDTIVMERSLSHPALDILHSTFGSQITTIEFGMCISFYVQDALSMCISCFPALKTLNYFVFFARAPRSAGDEGLLQLSHDLGFLIPSLYLTDVPPRSALTSIGLHPQVNFALGGDLERSMHLDSHVVWFMDRMKLPDLRHIRLFGDWAWQNMSEKFTAWKAEAGNFLEFVDQPEVWKDW